MSFDRSILKDFYYVVYYLFFCIYRILICGFKNIYIYFEEGFGNFMGERVFS